MIASGRLYANINGEWLGICNGTIESMDITPEEDDFDPCVATYTSSAEWSGTFSVTRQPTSRPTLTKKQAKKALKYEKNPMARKELQKIISEKEN